MANCVDTAGLSLHVSFPPADPEDNWQPVCEMDFEDSYMSYSVCVLCVCVKRKQTARERFVMLTLMPFVISPLYLHIESDMFAHCHVCVPGITQLCSFTQTSFSLHSAV